MTCAVFCIGTELTRGELVNTNSQWLCDKLTEAGFEVVEVVEVDDDIDRIGKTLRRLASIARVVVTTGGLGPTTDDMTSVAVGKALGVPVERDPAALEQIRARFARLGRPMSPSNEKQADFPRGASILPNPAGSAPGF